MATTINLDELELSYKKQIDNLKEKLLAIDLLRSDTIKDNKVILQSKLNAIDTIQTLSKEQLQVKRIIDLIGNDYSKDYPQIGKIYFIIKSFGKTGGYADDIKKRLLGLEPEFNEKRAAKLAGDFASRLLKLQFVKADTFTKKYKYYVD